MQGRILGFQGEAGVIQAADETRYPFARADWMEGDDPQRGALVDFVVEDGIARQIFMALAAKPAASLKPAPALNEAAALGSGIADRVRAASESDDAMGDILGRLRLAPQIALAIAILLACLGASFMRLGYENPALQKWGVLGLESEFTLLEVPDEADTLRESQYGRSNGQLEMRRKLQAADRELKKLDNFLTMLNAVWLLPLLALATIAAGWMRSALVKPVGTVLGVACCVVAFIPHVWQKMVVALLEAVLDKGDLLNVARRSAQKSFELESGGWILALLGLACIFTGVVQLDRRA